MIRIAKISLDIRKDAVVNNEPIILRQGESDVTIEATVLNGGDETLQINFATFVAKKPDGTIVSNDPANVNGSVIDYPVSNHLTESVGKIQDAYFMINNQITTCGFDISVIPSTQLDDTSVSYIPGIENINKFLTDTKNDWLGRIQQMKNEVDGLDVPAEFKLLMDKALSDAKAQYQPIIDAAEENVENIVADLAAKKLDLENNSDELNTTITAIKAQIAPVDSFLDNVQKQIIAANTSFTADQQAQVSQSIANLKAQIDALTVAKTGPKGDKGDTGEAGPTGPKGDKGDTGTVDNAGLISAPAFQSLQTQVDNSAVGTNLLLGTSSSEKSYTGNFSTASGWVNDPTLTPVIAVNVGNTYTYSIYLTKVTGSFALELWGYDNNEKYTSWFPSDTHSSSGKDSMTFTIPSGISYVSPHIVHRSDDFACTAKEEKFELATTATDWCPNPSEIATNDDVQTAITNALGKVDVGKTITATDDTGKTVKLKITGIS